MRRVVYSRFSSFPTTWAVAYKSLSRSEEEELSVSLSSLSHLCEEKEREREEGEEAEEARLRARTPHACAMWKNITRSRRDVRQYIHTFRAPADFLRPRR